MPAFHVTYEVITEESAEQGDAAERGFVMPGEWRFALDMDDATQYSATALRLQEALKLVSCVRDGGNGTDYYEVDARQNYRTDEETFYALHLPRNTTPASAARIKRLLRSRGQLIR